MVLRKLRFASSRFSAGEATAGESGSELWARPERPLVKRAGRVAMVTFDVGVCVCGMCPCGCACVCMRI